MCDVKSRIELFLGERKRRKVLLRKFLSHSHTTTKFLYYSPQIHRTKIKRTASFGKMLFKKFFLMEKLFRDEEKLFKGEFYKLFSVFVKEAVYFQNIFKKMKK